MAGRFKRVVWGVVLGAVLALGGAVPAMAQTLSIGILPDPGVLVSQARSSIDNAGQNLETSLVDITAVDAPVMGTHNGKAAMGAEQRCGQGVIIDPSGIIATNKHIVGEAPQHIYVMLAGGRKFEAKVVQNSQTDLALIKIDAPSPLRAVALGDSSRIQVGNRVHAFANAGSNPQREKSGEVIQVYAEKSSNTAAILEVNIRLKPGDSGGPILNEQGLLLGLIMANQISDTTKSYAIASNKIQQEYLRYKGSTLISSL